MTTTSPSLWQTIATLEQQMPLTRQAVEKTFNVALAETDRSDYFVTFTAKQTTALQDGLTVSTISMMLRPSMQFDAKSGLSFEMQGACISLDEVRKQFGELELTQSPRGRSPDETAAWSTPRPWGVLSFGFRQDRPDCLFRVTLRRQQ